MAVRTTTTRTPLGSCAPSISFSTNTCSNPAFVSSRKCNSSWDTCRNRNTSFWNTSWRTPFFGGTTHVNITRSPCNSWDFFNSWPSYRPIYTPPRVITPIVYTDSSPTIIDRKTTAADVAVTIALVATAIFLIAITPQCRDNLVLDNGEWFRQTICTQWTPW